MKTIEIRRHALRDKPNKHISQEGINVARRVGEEMGPFDLVITSTLPRALETAIAMGFFVHQRLEIIESYGNKIEKEVPWPQPFAVYQTAYQAGGLAMEYMQDLAAFYTSVVEALPEDGAALVISHGGIVEMSAVACLPEADYASSGPHCECCEGVRLFWEEDKCVKVEILRVSL
jgi:broad specificity phosphatase PhoE